MIKFFSSLTLTFWQVGVFKLSLVSIGIILGVYFSDFFKAGIPYLAVIFALTSAYLLVVWYKQVKG